MRSISRIVAAALVAVLAVVALSGCFGGKKLEPTFEVHSAIIEAQTAQNIYQMETNRYAKSVDQLKKFAADKKANGEYAANTNWRDDEVFLAITSNGTQYIIVGVGTKVASAISMQYVDGDNSVTNADFVEFGSVEEYNAAPSPIDGLDKPKL